MPDMSIYKPPEFFGSNSHIEIVEFTRHTMCASKIIFFLFLSTGLRQINANSYAVNTPTVWWQTATLYQVWPRSFQDSNGDGIGDLNGVTSRLEHLADMGVDVVWLSPFFKSPLVDSGYDISDYRDVNPVYGTVDDLDRLVARAAELGLRVILDYVPNHTSDEHEWFIKSKAGIEPYKNYYVWNDGILVNGTRQPPNNWLSVFNSGSAWEWVEERQQFYLHQFHVKQPDLNFTNPDVIQETKDILSFWLNRGIAGYRIDSLPYLIEDALLRDEPKSGLAGYEETDFYYLDHIYVKDQPENYGIVQIWRDHIDEYSRNAADGLTRIMFTEAYANISSVVKYYDFGSQVPFNFFFIKDGEGIDLAKLETAQDFADIINLWMSNMPVDGTANWVFGNHDNSRVATRFGEGRTDSINFCLYLLPGVAITFNGDEIGMTDTSLTWQQTEDPQACSTDPTRFATFSRDPERTPYQWDDSTSAGFSTNSMTMLPVNENYRTLNLAAQKKADKSYYKNVQALIKLRNEPVIREGSLTIKVISNSIIAFTRQLDGQQPIVVLINWSDAAVSGISLDVFEDMPDNLVVLLADVNSGISVGDKFDKNNIELPSEAAVVLQGVAACEKTVPADEKSTWSPLNLWFEKPILKILKKLGNRSSKWKWA
ncbi:maltase 2-like [Athalia rosae]|uniref:maltase 2-like n=1 Tax=Athalia rosae TaxID=37344 RepID=UPI002034265D|nr:maltase 2-like [Athalia rosae]